MISVMLFALAVLWIAFLRRYPWLFAPMRRRSSSIPRYHYEVCGTEELPTWQRKFRVANARTTRPR
jgi:hypothetical protein